MKKICLLCIFTTFSSLVVWNDVFVKKNQISSNAVRYAFLKHNQIIARTSFFDPGDLREGLINLEIKSEDDNLMGSASWMCVTSDDFLMVTNPKIPDNVRKIFKRLANVSEENNPGHMKAVKFEDVWGNYMMLPLSFF